MLVRFGQWLCESPRRAWVTAGLLAPLPLLGWLSGVIVALVTLRRGPNAGALVAVASGLPFAIWLVSHASLSLYLVLKLASLACVWLGASVLHQTRAWYTTLRVLTGLGILVVVGLHGVLGDMALFWQQHITQYLDSLLAQAKAQNMEGLTQALTFYSTLLAEQGALVYLSKVASGLLVLNTLMGIVIQLIVARAWQAKVFNPGGMQHELHALHLTQRDSLVLAACTAGAFMQLAVFIDLIPVVIGPFVFVALCFLHRVFMRRGWPPAAFYGCCMGLALLSPYSVVLLVGLSVFDSITDRTYVKR